MASILQRTVFGTSRAQEYFNARELQAQTGQPLFNLATVALKELVDNALDACEQSGVPPVIEIDTSVADGRLRILRCCFVFARRIARGLKEGLRF